MKPFAYYKLKAKAALRGNVLKVGTVALFSLLLTSFLYLYIDKLFPEDYIKNIIANIASAVFVIYPFTMGMNVFFLNLVRGKPASVGNVFDGYKYFFKMIPYMITALVISSANSYIGNLLLSEAFADDLFIRILLYAGMVLCMVGAIAIFFTMYILYDEKISGIKAVIKSIKLTSGNIIYIFGLMFSFIWWGLLIMFTFGLVILYLVPYMEITMIMLYDDIKNKKTKINEEKEPEL